MVSQTEIIELEQDYWQAMKDHDVDKAVLLTRFPCVISGPQGSRLVTEDDYRHLMDGHTGETFKDVELKGPKVEFFNEDTAIITYETERNGKTLQEISTWIRSPKGWLCAFHSENAILRS